MNSENIWCLESILKSVRGIWDQYYSNIRRDSSVGTATGYELDGRGSNPGRGKFFSSSQVQTGSGAHTASYPMGTGGNFPGGKVAEACEAHNPPLSSAEVKNGGAIPPLPNMS
jgi:hypothetical protein